MTRYDATHKEQTRRDILRAAARAFKARGIDRVGVADLMAEAGLTHGGFYAHFSGKEHLIGEVCVDTLREATRRFQRRAGEAQSGRPLELYVRWYLSREHRDDPGDGCVISALTGEVARHSPETRAAFTSAVRGYVGDIVALSDGALDENGAWALVAGMAGSVALARAVDDPARSDAILRSARELYGRWLEGAYATVTPAVTS